MASKFDQACTHYTKATVEINFPGGDVACRWCPLYGVEMASNRRYCRRTGEYVFSELQRGYECPLIIKEEDK